MKSILCVLLLAAVVLPNSSALRLSKWKKLLQSLKYKKWSECSDMFNTPCDCSFVTCTTVGGDTKITGIEFPDNLYKGEEVIININRVKDLEFLESFTIPWATNNFTFNRASGNCYSFDGADDTNCGFTGSAEDKVCDPNSPADGTNCAFPYGFCCHQKALLDLANIFSIGGWGKCAGRSYTLCQCDPSSQASLEIMCQNGIAYDFSLRSNNLAYSGDGKDMVDIVNTALAYGVTTGEDVSFKLAGNPVGNFDLGGNCPHFSGCELDGVTCGTMPFDTCTPTAAPTTGVPTRSPISSCEDINEYPMSRKNRIKACNAVPGGICETKLQKKHRGNECQTVTSTPTAAPTAPTVIGCEDYESISNSKSEFKTTCLQDQMCKFISNRRGNTKCYTAKDSFGNTTCSGINNEFASKQRINLCKAQDHCTIETEPYQGRQKGYCFEITSCVDVNFIKKRVRRERFCEEELDGCEFVNNQCQSVIL